MAGYRCNEEGSESCARRFVEISPGTDQQLATFCVASLSSSVERCVSFFRRLVDISSSTDQQVDDFRMSFLVEISTGADQLLDHFGVALSSSNVERSPSIAHSLVEISPC